MEQLQALTLPQRVVLLSVATLETDGETPAHANVVTQQSRTFTEELDELGHLTEADVDRALNKLEADELVTVPSMDGTSPTGKGRPAYSLSVDADTVIDALAEDDRLAAVVDA